MSDLVQQTKARKLIKSSSDGKILRLSDLNS